MTRIELAGIIGWDILATNVRTALAEAGGQVQLIINSPGGEVYEGIAIANALRDYRRQGGRVEGVISGIAASMASYVAMAVDEVTVEDNAVFMVHNPWMVAGGDYRDMTRAARLLSSLRALVARGYTAKTRREAEQILAEMDEETWLFGAEVVTAGYADRLIPAGDGPESSGEAMALAQAGVSALRTKLQERAADAAALDRIAALLPASAAPTAPPTETPSMSATEIPADDPTPAAPTPDPAPPAPAAEPAEAPTEDPIAQARTAERARASAILRACAAARCPERAAAMIDEGLSVDAARAQIIEAWAQQGGPELRQSGQGSAAAAAQADWSAVITQINARRA